MCGLTGFARHPKGPDLKLCIDIFSDLLVKNQKRGDHATGVAAVGGSKPFLLKKACEAKRFVQSDPYAQRVLGLAHNTTVLMGHTRHASHANRHEDEAAHPFHMGKVIGAHNGVVRNWRDIEKEVFAKNDGHEQWCNDSQAPFALLDKYEDVTKATNFLDGWWALTWTRDRMLHLCRTSGVDLHAAYSGKLRTLFWSSELAHLKDTLKVYGLDGFDIWKINANTIYRYDPTVFDEESTHGKKKDVPFKGIGAANRNVRLGVSGHGDDVQRPSRGGGYSTTRTLPPGTYSGGRTRWDATSAREIEIPLEAHSRELASLGKFGEVTQKMWDVISRMNLRLSALAADNQKLRDDVDWLNAAIEELGGTGLPLPDICQQELPLVDAGLAHIDNAQGDGAGDDEEDGEAYATCVTCLKGPEAGDLLKLPEGGHVHEKCVLSLTQ